MIKEIKEKNKNRVDKVLVFTQIFFIFILPVFLIYFKVFTSFYFRFIFLLLGALFIYGIIRYEKWSYEDMGLRMDNFKKSFLPYLVFTLLGVLVIFLTAYFFGIKNEPDRVFYIRTFLFFIPISFVQEFAFRSFLIPQLKKIHKNNYLVIFLNSLLFALIHIIYPDINIGVPLSFVGGIFFAYLYLKYPNLLLISISHSILNLTALLLGFFVPTS